MRLPDEDDKYFIVDKDTDHRKAQEKITRTSFVKLDFDPMHVHKKYRSIKK